MKIVSIHQPNFLPWIGYFYKMAKSDIFVFLDNVQFSKNSFTNRNRIKTSQGIIWITVPVKTRGKFGQHIKDVEINNAINWRKKHLKTFEANYKRAKFFKEVYELLEEIYYQKEWKYLADFNISLIERIIDFMGLKKVKTLEFVRSSELGINGKGTELLIKITKEVGGNVYLSGFGGKNYQEEKLFERNGVKLQYYDFIHPTYPQLWTDFTPNLSIVDLLFNCGNKSLDFILQPK